MRRLLVLVALTLVVAACSSSSSSTPPTTTSTVPPPTTPPCNKPHAAGQTTETWDFQGKPRTYELYVPQTYDGGRNVPVVFNFHGYGSTAKEQMVYGNYKPLADRDDFLIVAPDGQDVGARHFNLGNETGPQNDVVMTLDLLDRIESQLCVDAKRVYATGMSDGGAMTSILACVAANKFAAFGAVAVILYLPQFCDRTRPLAIADFSGTADPIVPFNGGTVNCCGGQQLGAAPAAMASWAAHDGCSAAFTDDNLSSEVTRRTWQGCPPGDDVDFYMIQGGGHTWPGSPFSPTYLGMTTQQIDASATIWTFFQAHPLP